MIAVALVGKIDTGCPNRSYNQLLSS